MIEKTMTVEQFIAAVKLQIEIEKQKEKPNLETIRNIIESIDTVRDWLEGLQNPYDN